MSNLDAMKSPIGKMVDGVFFWVRDLQASIEQYSQLFGIPIDESQLGGSIYVFPLANGTDVILDGNGMKEIPFQEHTPLLCMLGTDNIDEAYHFVQRLGFEITFGIFRNEYVAFFDMRDADHNRIKICQQF